MRMWEIRENTGRYDSDYRMGMKDKSVKDAYKCGYEDGYADAMEEVAERKYGKSSYRMEEDEERSGNRRYR